MVDQYTGLNPQERVAVLLHWLKGLTVVPGTALDGVEMAGKVASFQGGAHLAPSWVEAWEDSGRPLSGVVLPRAKPQGGRRAFADELPQEEKQFSALMESLDDLLLGSGLISDPESEHLMGQWWTLYNEDREEAVKTLTLLNRVMAKARQSKKK